MTFATLNTRWATVALAAGLSGPAALAVPAGAIDSEDLGEGTLPGDAVADSPEEGSSLYTLQVENAIGAVPAAEDAPSTDPFTLNDVFAQAGDQLQAMRVSWTGEKPSPRAPVGTHPFAALGMSMMGMAGVFVLGRMRTTDEPDEIALTTKQIWAIHHAILNLGGNLIQSEAQIRPHVQHIPGICNNLQDEDGPLVALTLAWAALSECYNLELVRALLKLDPQNQILRQLVTEQKLPVNLEPASQVTAAVSLQAHFRGVSDSTLTAAQKRAMADFIREHMGVLFDTSNYFRFALSGIDGLFASLPTGASTAVMAAKLAEEATARGCLTEVIRAIHQEFPANDALCFMLTQQNLRQHIVVSPPAVDATQTNQQQQQQQQPRMAPIAPVVVKEDWINRLETEAERDARVNLSRGREAKVEEAMKSQNWKHLLGAVARAIDEVRDIRGFLTRAGIDRSRINTEGASQVVWSEIWNQSSNNYIPGLSKLLTALEGDDRTKNLTELKPVQELMKDLRN